MTQAAAPYRAGFARRDITPSHPAVLAGYGITFVYSMIAAPLFAKAMALAWAEGPPIVVVSIDTLKLREPLATAIGAGVTAATGLPANRLVLVSTHTHCAPLLPGHYGNSEPFLGDLLTPDLRKNVELYGERLVREIAGVVTEAIANLQPVSIAFNTGVARFAVNRRERLDDGSVRIGVNRDARVDWSVPTLRVSDPDGQVRGVLFGYACHGTTMKPEVVGPDYMGFAEDFLRQTFPEAIPLFLPGFGADTNPAPWADDIPSWPHSDGGVQNAMRHGLELAGAVAAAINDPMMQLDAEPQYERHELSLPLAPPPNREALLEELRTIRPVEPRYALRVARAKAYLEMHEANALARAVQLPLSVLTIGQLSIVFIAGEVVSDYAFAICERTSRTIWPVGYAHQSPAYIPSARVIAEGGYEPGASMINNGWYGPFLPEIEPLILDKVEDLLCA